MGLFWQRPPPVARLKKIGDLDGLLRALHYEDPIIDADGKFVDLGASVRGSAAAALAEIDAPAARDGLSQALADPEESVRLTTLRALASRIGAHSLELLSGVAGTWQDPDLATAREEAVQALEGSDDAMAARHLAAVLLKRPADLDRGDIETFQRVAHGAGTAGARATIDDLLVRIREDPSPDRAAALLVALAPDSIEDLIGLLGDPDVGETAALALGSTHHARAVEPLADLVAAGRDPGLRRAAAWALGEIRDPAAADVLLAAASDRDYDIRSTAIEAFDKLGNAGLAAVTGESAPAAPQNGSVHQVEPAPQPAEDEPTTPLVPAPAPFQTAPPSRQNGGSVPYRNGSHVERPVATELTRLTPLRRLLGRQRY